jgi:hypothetical protein
MENNEVNVVYPQNLGWIEKRLSNSEVSYLWNCIDNQTQESYKNILAGNIYKSNKLIDVDDFFFNNTIIPLCKIYADKFGNLGNYLPTNKSHPYCLDKFWVNFQRQNEFNPVHTHSGIYSFVIWMKIPTRHDEQNQNLIAANSNSPRISTFEIIYSDILGKCKTHIYKMDPETEGLMLFFPSELMHQVYPYYNCDEYRISISGNVFLDTTRTFSN